VRRLYVHQVQEKGSISSYIVRPRETTNTLGPIIDHPYPCLHPCVNHQIQRNVRRAFFRTCRIGPRTDLFGRSPMAGELFNPFWALAVWKWEADGVLAVSTCRVKKNVQSGCRICRCAVSLACGPYSRRSEPHASPVRAIFSVPLRHPRPEEIQLTRSGTIPRADSSVDQRTHQNPERRACPESARWSSGQRPRHSVWAA
jgi:hypothetical protein